MFTHRALYAALTGQPLRLYGTAQRRDFTCIDDVVAATIAAGTRPERARCHQQRRRRLGRLPAGRRSNIASSLTGREIQLRRTTCATGT